MHQITIEKMAGGGQGLGFIDGAAAFIWNALPGETVEVENLHKRKGVYEGIATKILISSPDRTVPRDPNFLDTAALDIITPEAENALKRQIAKETYAKIGGLILDEKNISIFSDNNIYNYRNKIEFNFCDDANGQSALAFHHRGTHTLFPVEFSHLANSVINETAEYILNWIHAEKIPRRSLKSLIIRCAKEQTIAALFLKDELVLKTFPELTATFTGLEIVYSTHKSPASVVTKPMHTLGAPFLTQNILEAPLNYGVFSFFQINPPLFEAALKDIASFTHPNDELLDLYCGVGSIGIPLSRQRKNLTLIDITNDNIEFARQNCAANGLKNALTICAPAEKTTDYIQNNQVVIVDPPRVGLHPNVVSKILQTGPKRVIYLSCDIATQARDLRLLSEKYTVSATKLYNFFPRTPHIEGLAILDKIN